MAKVKILIEGYTTADTAESGEEKTCPTITLVKDKDIVMVVDPGVLEDQKILTDALKNEGLTINDVNIVCITHSHIDHYRNIGMFPKAKTLEYWGLWDKNTVEDWEEQFTDDIKIVKTPGHNYDGITLLVKTDEGNIAICGDVFWKENFPENDAYASDMELLEKSRKQVLEMADYVIPGHSGMFKVRK
jgi:glyoxylase-like metal-dependent hydrolase (beta-lactamase superfamily II)